MSKRFAVERRGGCPTGVHAVASLLKLLPCEAYLRRGRALSTHQSFVAERMDEPKDDRCVDMLQALPESERLFYSSEDNVVDLSDFSQVVYDELHQRYAFLGGRESEWIKYLNRSDLPVGLWRFITAPHVKAVTGISAVQKK